MKRWLPLAFLALLSLAHSAWAQTTTFPGSVCDPGFSVSGGVNVSVPASGGAAANCIADVGKGSQLWYFTYRGTPGWTAGVGVADSGMPTNGAIFGGGEVIGSGGNSTGYWINQDGSPKNIGQTVAPNPPGTITTPAITFAPGATVGIAVDLDSAPRQIWITPDITGTSGCGGGPLWNGDANSAPLVRGGCGGPGTGAVTPYTGLYFGLNLPPVFPALTGQNFGGQETSVTFDFTDNATLDALLAGGGYQAWNTPGGNTVVTNPVTANIANAPKWQSSHAYVAGDRVLAGPGLSGSSFVYGQPLHLWVVAGSGGTSASSGNGPQDCPDPAGYGGGFAGFTPPQWSGHTTVSDGSGSLVWTCLTAVDYTTVHDMNWDAPPWQPSHLYYYWQRALSTGNASLRMTSNHGNSPASCISGTTPPVDGGSDGNCTWESAGAGTITYSSGNNRILHLFEPFQNSGNHVLSLSGTANMVEWDGGLEKQTYTGGTAGEDAPITIIWQVETDEAGEAENTCYDGITDLQNAGCGYYPLLNITAAPGDSFAETLALTNGPLRPDSANGVMFTSSGVPSNQNIAISVYGYGTDVSGLQVVNHDNVAFAGGSDPPNSAGQVWGGTMSNLIVEGSGCAAFTGGSIDIWNSLIIYDNPSCDYGGAVYSRFPRNMYNVIIQGGPGVSSNSTLIASESQKPEYPTNEGTPFAGASVSNIQNSWIGGFANPIYYLSLPDGVTPQFGPVTGSNNATDTPSGYVPIPAPVPIPWGGQGPYYGGPTWPMPGTTGSGCGGPCQGLNAADVFVSSVPPYDFRLKPGSPAIGAGAGPLIFPPLGYTSIVPSTDIYLNARPTSGRYDIGAAQFAGSPPTVSITSLNLSADTFVAGTPSTVGDFTTILNSGFFSGTDTLVTSGGSCSGGDITHFAISGSSPSYSLTTTGPAAGAYPICVSSDQPGASNTPFVQPFTITGTSLPSPPVITSSMTATGNVGTPFSYQITATNSPTSFGATSLPSDGLSLNTSTGFITGTPTSTASISSTISATNAGGTGTGPLAITISGTTMTTIVVANAPGWVANHTYSAGDRQLAGPGWTPGSPGSFTSYSPLYVWGTSTGGVSGSSQPGGFASCPSPAGYGGALVNPTVPPSQWSGSTSVNDNGITWTCLTAVDNVSESDMNIDAPVYQNGGSYFNGQLVAFNNTIYQNVKTPLAMIEFCTTNTSSPLTDTGCAWSSIGTIQYSAGINYWPHQAYSSGTTVNYVSQLTGPVTVEFVHGGLTTRPSYQAGVAGETAPMVVSNHYDYTGSDTQPDGTDYPFILTAFPGDSFRDNLTVGAGPLRFDATKGVNFFANGPWSGLDRGVPFATSDSGGSLIGLQIQSVNGAAIEGQFSVNNINSGHSNNITLADDIIDAGGTTSGPDRGLSPDGGWVLHDNTITCRSPFVGGVCVESKYVTLLYNNTIIGPGTSNATANSQLNTAFGLPEFYNNNLFGFAHTFAWALTAQTSPVGGAATNAIDSATNTSGTSFTGPATSGISGAPGDTFVTAVIPLDATCGSSNTATCAGLSAANQFINPTPGSSLDLRLKTSPLADVAGAGASFTSSVFGLSGPGSDILGQSRGSVIDLGAITAAGTSPATSGGFRRLDRW